MRKLRKTCIRDCSNLSPRLNKDGSHDRGLIASSESNRLPVTTSSLVGRTISGQRSAYKISDSA